MVALKDAIKEINTGKIIFAEKEPDTTLTTEGEVVIYLERLEAIYDKSEPIVKRVSELIGKYVEHVASDESMPFEIKQYISALLGRLTVEIENEILG